MSAKIKPTLYIIQNLTRQGFGDMWELAILFIRITKRILKMLVLLKSCDHPNSLAAEHRNDS